MSVMRFSLITGTLGRTQELERLLASLADQGRCDFELIVVDQNTDERLVPILARWLNHMADQSAGAFSARHLIHLRCQPGLSRARNLALGACSGEIIAFPDDDCWYPAETLGNVDRWFLENPNYTILSMTARDEAGGRSANKWFAESCDLAPHNIFRTSASFTFFVRRPSPTYPLQFDEALGIGSGTRFGSAEDTDFLLNIMDRGGRGRFLAKWYIGHPQKDMTGGNMTRDRSLSYGLGMGRVLAKHSLWLMWIAFVMFDLGRAVLLSCKRKQLPASLYFAHGKGLLSAYFSSGT
jgi:glycosyltransferase involved in cell wall biosynthesis